MSGNMIHLEGMGVVGSLVAQHLALANRPFTWDDQERDVCAWRACTGGIYPTGIPYEQDAYMAWKEWAEADWAQGLVEQGDFWFLSKRPPHEGVYGIRDQVGPLRLGALPSYHLNAQELVLRTREQYAAQRTDPRLGETLVVTHGYGPRLHHYLWGWHAKVFLNIDPALAGTGRRACFYLRTDRFTMLYAYPVPGQHNSWFAGSATLMQRRAAPLRIAPKLEQWCQRISIATQGMVRARSVTSIAEGWRPCPDKEDTALVKRIGSRYHLRPMSHSGVRLAPHLIQAVMEIER